MGQLEGDTDRSSEVSAADVQAAHKLGELVDALLDKFTWVKVSKTKSMFGTTATTVTVTHIHKNQALSMTHVCTDLELTGMSDAAVIVDAIWEGMLRELHKKFGATKK